jgi:putative ABC transport system permease protein
MNRLFLAMKLGLLDLMYHKKLVLVMALSIAITITIFAGIELYRAGMKIKYTELAPQYLLVHENQTLGEFYGSRMPASVGDNLQALGISRVIPELRAIAGTSAENAVLVRGVDLEQFTSLESFTVLSGRQLVPGEASRNAMIGWRLAASRGLSTGDTVSLRGRDFSVIGVFKNGTYMDNQAWISLSDAQTLLGWGTDVSVLIIPDEGIVQEGDPILEGITVTRKGESLKFTLDQYKPIFDLLQLVVFILGAASALALSNILLRLAWLRRREMAVIRTNGFPVMVLVEYLFTQSACITFTGFIFGIIFTATFTLLVKIALPSFTLVPHLEKGAAISIILAACLIMAAGSVLPAWWLGRTNLAAQLHAE